MSEPTYDHLVIALGRGAIEVGQGHDGIERLPAILFGRNGAGTVGVETEGDRIMLPGECIAAITFENPESLDVVAEKLAELRARIWPDVALSATNAALLNARAEGRAEALHLLTSLDPDCGIDDYIGWSLPLSSDDEGSAHWEVEELRKLFGCDDKLLNLFDRAEEMYWEYLGNRDEAERSQNFADNAPGCAAVRKFLEEEKQWDLLHDLLSRSTEQVAPTTGAQP